MFFILGGCLDAPMFVCPHVCMPPVHLYTPYIHSPQGCTYPHMPPYSASVCFWRLCMLWGVVMGSPLCWDTSLTPTLFGVPPLQFHPHTQSLVPYALVCFRDINMLCGHFPSVEGFGGVLLISWGGLGGISTWGVHMLILVHFCSALCLMFWLWLWLLLLPLQWYLLAFFCVISDSGSFPDRVSSKLGSAWHGSTTTLDAERLWRCFWLSFCATAANSIFNASFSLCQLCYEFSTGRFLFQNWASHHFVSYICLVSVLVSVFTFRCWVGCHIHLWGLNH